MCVSVSVCPLFEVNTSATKEMKNKQLFLKYFLTHPMRRYICRIQIATKCLCGRISLVSLSSIKRLTGHVLLGKRQSQTKRHKDRQRIAVEMTVVGYSLIKNSPIVGGEACF